MSDETIDDQVTREFIVVLVGGPMAGQVVSVPAVAEPAVVEDDHGGRQEYRPDGSTAYSAGHDTHLPVFRHYAPAD